MKPSRQSSKVSLRSQSGAFDLPSIITAVVVAGILVAGVLTAIFGVIPWSQDNTAKQDLATVRTAEGTHAAKDTGFTGLAGLQSSRYLPQSVDRLTVSADTAGACYMGISKSQSGKVFYSTDKANDPQEMTPTTAATPGTTMLPCVPATSVQQMVDTVGGYSPHVYDPVGAGSGTTASPGTAVAGASSQVTPVSPATPNTSVSTAGVTITDQSLKVSFQNTSPSPTTVNYGGRITCYDPSRNSTTVQDIHGYFDLDSNIFADMALTACIPGTQPVDVEFFPYDVTWPTGTYYHWRAPVVFPQATWVSGGLTASYDGLWCIENQNDAATAGNPINLAHCASVNAQRWQWNGDGEIRQSTLDHKCAASSADKLVLADCSAGPGQAFTAQLFQGTNTTGGLVQIIDKASGKCVDVPGGSLAAVQLSLAPCNGSSTQSWYMPGLAATLTAALQQPQPSQTAPAAPANLSGTAYPATTANFSWTAATGATGYHVDYRVNGGAWQVQSDTQTATTASFTGAPNDLFDVRVTAKNASGESGYSTASYTLPGLTVINGGFEAGLTGWSLSGNNHNAQTVTTNHSGAYSLELGNYYPGDSTLSQAVQVAADGNSSLSFWYQPFQAEQNLNNDWTEVEIRDATGTTTLQKVFKNNTVNSSWINQTVDLTPYRGQTVTLWFNVHDDGSVTTTSRFDDVTVTNTVSTAPAAPVEVFASRTGSSAALSWKQISDGGSTITSYMVTPLINGVAQAPIQVAGNQTSATVTGLADGIYNAFTVAATNAAGTSTASDPSQPVQNGGFENGLTSWTTSGDVATTTYGYASGRNGTQAVTLGGKQNNSNSTLTQSVHVPESGTSTLSFWYKPNLENCCDWAEAEIRDQAGNTLSKIFRSSSNSNVWTNQTADLTPYNGQTVTIWFNVWDDWSSPTAAIFDDVSIASGPAVIATVPADVTATRSGSDAVVAWSQFSDGGSWVTTYTVTPSANGVAQAPIVVTGSPAARSVTVPGLTVGTNYSFTVTATNAVGTSGASLSSSTVLNSGFENSFASWTTGGTQLPVVQFGGHTGQKAAFLGNRAGTDSNVSQTIDVPSTGTTTLSYWLQATLENCCDPFEVKVTDASGNTTSVLRTTANTNGWANQTVDLTAYKGQRVTLMFNLHNDGSVISYGYLDDVRVTTTG